MQYYNGDQSIFNKVIKLIKQNINFRLTDLEYLTPENKLQLENIQKLSEKNIQNAIFYNYDNILEIISSKGPERLFCFIFFLNGYNIFNRKKYHWYDDILSNNPVYFHILVSIFIINTQIFSDANHRSAAYYLQINNFDLEIIKKIIDIIKYLRNIIKIDYSTITTDSSNGIYSFNHFTNNIHTMYHNYFIEFI